ncbi:hypothetical protein FRC03_002376 [Tulasnella sp. 419]|nr:hypothetical protein FRC03_002376 [Tulasnella sp. 419]
MPRLDTSASRAKTRSPTSSPPPTSPHRAKLPVTPAAVARPNPIDSAVTRSPRAATEPMTKPLSPSNAKVVPRAGTVEPSATPTEAAAPPPSKSSTTSAKPAAPLTQEEIMDMEIFNQILEMDDDPDNRDFSPTIVIEYLEQAVETFIKMDTALKNKELDKLASLGHFLKGSSAALGIKRVRDCCESIQNYGHLRGDDPNNRDDKLDPEEALKRIAKLIVEVRGEYQIGKTWLEDFYGPALHAEQ